MDIEEHRNKQGNFDKDMIELQQHFIAEFLEQFFTEIHMPVIKFKNCSPQNNNIPEELMDIRPFVTVNSPIMIK